MNSPQDFWLLILPELKKKLNETSVRTWFDDVKAIALTSTSLVLTTPSPMKRKVITDSYKAQIEEILQEFFAHPMDVEILLADSADSAAAEERSAQTQTLSALEAFTFESFIVGKSNELAYKAAVAVTEKPGVTYNPLFIYGNSGLGKTHLICAIANRMKQMRPDLRVTYCRGDQFTNELVEAIGQGRNVDFRVKYRENCDLLLVDDVQFIAGKISTQEEFFHTFNELYLSGKQIVLTSDRPPNEVSRLEDRLRTRFEQGVIIDIQPPELETRMAIIRSKANDIGLTDLSDGIVEYIAQNVTGSVRQLEGTVRKMLAYSNLMGADINLDTVIRAIRDVIKENKFAPKPDEIVEETAKFYGFTPDEIRRGAGRSKEITQARQISMFLIRSMTSLTLAEIGRYFGKDHSTVMYGLDRIESKQKTDRKIAEDIRDLQSNLNARGG